MEIEGSYVLHRNFALHSRKSETDPDHWTMVGILADGSALVLERPHHLRGMVTSADPHALTDWTPTETFHFYPEGSSATPSYQEHESGPVWIVPLDLAIRLANAFCQVMLDDTGAKMAVEREVVEWQARVQARVVNPLLVNHPPPVKKDRESNKRYKDYTLNMNADLKLATPLLVSR
jgi:hypothetical protein